MGSEMCIRDRNAAQVTLHEDTVYDVRVPMVESTYRIYVALNVLSYPLLNVSFVSLCNTILSLFRKIWSSRIISRPGIVSNLLSYLIFILSPESFK